MSFKTVYLGSYCAYCRAGGQTFWAFLYVWFAREVFYCSKCRCLGTVAAGVATFPKGMDDFIRVAHEIQKMRQDVVFLIIGDGKKRMTLERMSLQYDVDILFLGDRLDVPDLLSIFDVFLFTSKWEPFGIVLLEAMAAKVPILGFAVGGAREIIDKGGGVLFEKRDHEKLAQLTVQVLGDQKTYERLSAQGYANMMRNFNIASSIKDLEKEYMALLSKQ